MDAFYASVEIRDRPELADKPVVVGGTPGGRGVVAAANYIAREYGVHSALPAAEAKRRCPHAVFLPSRMEHYAAISRQIRAIFDRFSPLAEPLSLDEAFLDLTGCERLLGDGETVARGIKTAVSEELSLTASVGVARNKFLAKLASALGKPDGLLVVPDDVDAFLDPLPVSKLWGVGKVTRGRLETMGIYTVRDLRQRGQAALVAALGPSGEHLWALARGEDDRLVVVDSEAKSISHETTFEVDIRDHEILRTWLLSLTEQVARRLRRQQLTAGTVDIKIRYSDFRTVTRSRTIRAPTNTTQALWQIALELLDAQLSRCRDPVRLLGMGGSQLGAVGPRQADLFGEAEHARQQQLDAVVDAINNRFGQRSIGRRGPFRPGEKS